MNIVIENVEQLSLASAPGGTPMLDAMVAAAIAHAMATAVVKPAPAGNAAAPAAPAPGTEIPPRIGQPWPGEGGTYAGMMRGQGDQPDYHLIVAPAADGEHATASWGDRGVKVDGADDEWDGAANTAALHARDQSHPAADFTADVSIEGHDDYYLPSRRELRLCWVNVPELFGKGVWYWSSTQYSALNAWGQDFDDGYQDDFDKEYEGRARAVRRLSA